jgi:hypothetical protein
MIAPLNYVRKLQVQVEHLGKMAADSGSIKAIEKLLEKFFWGSVVESLAWTAIQLICKPQYIFGSVFLNRNTLGDVL